MLQTWLEPVPPLSSPRFPLSLSLCIYEFGPLSEKNSLFDQFFVKLLWALFSTRSHPWPAILGLPSPCLAKNPDKLLYQESSHPWYLIKFFLVILHPLIPSPYPLAKNPPCLGEKMKIEEKWILVTKKDVSHFRAPLTMFCNPTVSRY